ncbi:hypothetical protein IT400_01325 [Candidatus Nomurabacteria bacterium]|nr:hypothetical protein [Candidatus Nomurabacteria bacterium]
MNIIEKVKSLNLPLGQYVIIGSGIMDALGIRNAVDVDLAVLPELHKRMRESGEWNEEDRFGRIFLTKDVFECNPDISWDQYPTTTEQAITSATVINGVPFMNLKELIKFKTALGREKDYKDIELIKNYISS